jgi:hypothetical protein
MINRGAENTQTENAQTNTDPNIMVTLMMVPLIMTWVMAIIMGKSRHRNSS